MVSNRSKASQSSEERRQEALDDALLSIEKSYGKGAIMRMGDREVVAVDGISTGSLGLDLAIGGSGLPRGRVVEIFGPESSGKTTLTLHVVAAAQKRGGTAAFIDAEHALDPQYAKKLGVEIDSLLIAQPDNGEQALDICETLVRSGGVSVIVIDSVAALVPKAEIEGEMGDHFVGLHARLMSQALRKLTGAVAKTNTCLIFINQIREKIGVMFGSPETTTGGRALKFYSSVRLDIRRIGQIKEGDRPTGSRTKVTVVKNKMAPPFRKVEFDILFNRGINQTGELLDLGVEHGVLRRSGTWVSYKDTRLGQGRERSREFLDERPELKEELRAAILQVLGYGPLIEESTEESRGESRGESGDGVAPKDGKPGASKPGNRSAGQKPSAARTSGGATPSRAAASNGGGRGATAKSASTRGAAGRS